MCSVGICVIGVVFVFVVPMQRFIISLHKYFICTKTTYVLSHFLHKVVDVHIMNRKMLPTFSETTNAYNNNCIINRNQHTSSCAAFTIKTFGFWF